MVSCRWMSMRPRVVLPSKCCFPTGALKF